MIEIYLLEQLSAFAEHGTLSKAAEALHISQPALSRSMKKIEEELGVSLFDRDKAKISLNETGELAARLANELLSLNLGMIRRIKAFDRSQRSITVGACAPFPMNELMPLLQEYFGGMLITSELAEIVDIENGLLDNTYQIGILNKPTESAELFCQRFVSEHLYISVTKTHRLAKRDYIKFEDFEGESFLLFQHIGFWKDICNEKMKGANFLVQSSMDSLEELINGTDFPCFTTDAFINTAPYGNNRTVIPIEEPEAYATFYIACQNSYKKKYASFFNSIRSRSIKE
ncbi:MAG: LysR family transcriptional regulator [Clostridiales bacterium]|nr:LysR family transcriptional regulator [Clostridiales bacterium]